MAVRVADSLKQQNDLKSFPVAYSEDIWLDQNKGKGDADYKDLQTLYNENKLGGSGLPEPESADKVLVSASSNTRADGLEWKQVSKNDVGLQLPEFESLEEWDSLPAEEKSKYYNAGKGYVVIKEDVKGAKGVIDDTKPNSTVTTLSAKKINDSLVDIESALDGKQNFTKIDERTKTIEELFNEQDNITCAYQSRFNDGVGNDFGFVTIQKTNTKYGNVTFHSNNGIYQNRITNGVWSGWKELATMDKVEDKIERKDNPAELDFNKLLTTARYSIGSMYQNMPTQDIGILIVDNAQTYTSQIFITDNATYTRLHRDTGWYGWQKLSQ